MSKKIIFVSVLAMSSLLALPRKIWDQQAAAPVVAAVSTSDVTAVLPPPAVEPGPVLKLGQKPPELLAKAVLAIDLVSGRELYATNYDKKLPIASLTKLMTAMVVADRISPQAVVTVQKMDTKVDCSCIGLIPSERITVESLLQGLLIPSGNDAATALARSVGATEEEFVNMMNEKAVLLGLTQTHFENPIGLDNPENYSTAEDVAVMTKEFLKYSMLSEIVGTKKADIYSVDGKIKHHLETSNKLLLANPEVEGVKTGFTDQAQGNLVIKVKHQGTSVLTIVLNTPNREADSQRLIDWIYQAYQW